MSATETAKEAPDVARLTDRAIAVEIAKLGRMIGARQGDIDDLRHEIAELQAKRDGLIEAQVARLKAQLSTSASEGTNGE
jgi:hypothetical protein